VGLELPREAGKSHVALRDHHDPARSLVQAVHDSRPQDAAHSGEIPAMGQNRVHERSTADSSCRMDHHPGRFHENEEVRVFVKDGERDLLGLGLAGLGRRQDHANPIARPQPMSLFIWER